MRTFAALLIITVLGFSLNGITDRAQAKTPPPVQQTFDQPQPHVPASAREAGAGVLKLLSDIQASAQQYGEQAKTYDGANMALRICALILSLVAATVLALSASDWARKTALLASILAAAVPVGDQIFQVGELRRTYWRAAVDASRLFVDCRDNWELLARNADDANRRSETAELVRQCRERLAKVEDTEMETSLKQLQLPAKNEAK